MSYPDLVRKCGDMYVLEVKRLPDTISLNPNMRCPLVDTDEHYHNKC